MCRSSFVVWCVIFFSASFHVFSSLSSNLWHCLFGFRCYCWSRLWPFATLTITFLVRNSSSIKRQTKVEAHRAMARLIFLSVTFFFTHSFIVCAWVPVCVWNILLLYIYDEKRCSYFVYWRLTQINFFHTTKIAKRRRDREREKAQHLEMKVLCVYKSTLKFFWIVVKLRCLGVCVCGCVLLSMNQIFSFPLLNVENETNNLNVSVSPPLSPSVYIRVSATEFQLNFYFRFRLEVFAVAVSAW